VKAAIWQNQSESSGSFFTVTVARGWRDDNNEWHDSSSFNFNDLPNLAKAVSDAHSWIAWQEKRREEAAK
jgi:hypothetical protein